MKRATKGLMLSILVPALMAATVPSGSLTTFGDTSVSGVHVQSGTAVFPGDLITTGSNSAVYNLSNGRTVQIGPNSALRISKDSTVDVVKGSSRMQSKSTAFVMLAANYRLQGTPDKNGLTADVVRESDGRVALNVTSGKVVATSNTGRYTLVAEAGRPAMLPSSAPEPSGTPAGSPAGSPSPSPSPQGGGGSNKGLIVGAFLVGAVGLAVGAAALADQPADNSSQVAALQSQTTSLSSQITALNSQTANLLTNLNAVSAAASQSQALNTQLSVQIGNLLAAQAALAAAQTQINVLLAKVANGGTLTPADQATLASLQQTIATQSAAVAAAAAAANSLINQIKAITIPSNFKP